MLRFLVIEDDLVVAAYLDLLLSEEGLDVVGPVGTLGEAKLLARAATLDGALLDVNIIGGRIDDVADILTRRNIPFLFVTSAACEDLPSNHREVPVVRKPFKNADLMRAIRAQIRHKGSN